MPILFHGTTLFRARQIQAKGPDPDYVEPGGSALADSFSACLAFGPFECTERPEIYARGKARTSLAEGRDEGGPAILMVEVPEDIIGLAIDEWFPLTQGFVQFDRGPSLDALLVTWPNLEKRILSFLDPRR